MNGGYREAIGAREAAVPGFRPEVCFDPFHVVPARRRRGPTRRIAHRARPATAAGSRACAGRCSKPPRTGRPPARRAARCRRQRPALPRLLLKAQLRLLYHLEDPGALQQPHGSPQPQGPAAPAPVLRLSRRRATDRADLPLLHPTRHRPAAAMRSTQTPRSPRNGRPMSRTRRHISQSAHVRGRCCAPGALHNTAIAPIAYRQIWPRGDTFDQRTVKTVAWSVSSWALAPALRRGPPTSRVV